MSDPVEMARDLRAHLALREEPLLIVEREGQRLRTPGPAGHFEYYLLRKNLLPQLDQSLGQSKNIASSGSASIRRRANKIPKSPPCCGSTGTWP